MKYSVIDDSLVKISDIGVRDMQVYPPLTILMVVRSGILRRTLPIAILKNEATINQDIKAICLYDNSIANYIFWVLKASEQSILEIYQKDGTTVESINFERFKDVVIPIPPYSEQRRIVSAIETAFSLIDEIEENKTSIEQLIKQTKSKVLDLSVRGKLVRQRNDEEPVSSLLSKINGRQKSPNPSADIFHYPFKVPNSWIWAKGSECFNPMENKRPTGDIFGYIDINSIDNKKHTIAKLKYLKASEAPSRASRRVNAGDILFSMVRPYLENIAYVDKQFVDCIASTGFYVCKPRPLLFPKYLYYLMLSPYVINGLNTFMKGDNSPSINNDNITSFLYPLPPLQEQLRIVDQIEKILAQLDKIEEAIKA